MSTDIHVHIEIKIRGRWHHYNHPRLTTRAYDLFTKMAGVRDRDEGIEPIAQPRGIPKNASFTTRFDVEKWDSDGHSHSYLSSVEMAELSRWWRDSKNMDVNDFHGFEAQFGYIFGNTWEGWIKFPGDRPKDVEDVRCVFWFDC